jgi:hypothetical protein
MRRACSWTAAISTVQAMLQAQTKALMATQGSVGTLRSFYTNSLAGAPIAVNDTAEPVLSASGGGLKGSALVAAIVVGAVPTGPLMFAVTHLRQLFRGPLPRVHTQAGAAPSPACVRACERGCRSWCMTPASSHSLLCCPRCRPPL